MFDVSSDDGNFILPPSIGFGATSSQTESSLLGASSIITPNKTPLRPIKYTSSKKRGGTVQMHPQIHLSASSSSLPGRGGKWGKAGRASYSTGGQSDDESLNSSIVDMSVLAAPRVLESRGLGSLSRGNSASVMSGSALAGESPYDADGFSLSFP